MFSSEQMTKVRPTPTWLPSPPLDQEGSASRSDVATLISFFDPASDGVSRNPKGTRQPTQTATLFVSSQDLLTLFIRVGVRAGIVATTATTIVAQVTLFAIGGMSEANDILAVAMLTEEGDGYHYHVSISYHPLLSHYQIY